MNGGTVGGLTSERLQEYVVDSNAAISFRLIRAGEDVSEATREDNAGERQGDFPPEMTHQIYGEK